MRLQLHLLPKRTFGFSVLWQNNSKVTKLARKLDFPAFLGVSHQTNATAKRAKKSLFIIY